MLGNITIETWAVVLGATDSMLSLSLPFGYEFKRLRLDETPIYQEVLNQNGKIDVKYMASNLSENDRPEYIFLHKKETGSISIEYFTMYEMLTGNKSAYQFFDESISKWNKEIFVILSMLRISQEGNIEIADKFYYISAKYNYNNIIDKRIVSLDRPNSVYGDFYEWDNANNTVFQMLSSLSNPILEQLINIFERFGRGYSESRKDDAYKNLVTLLEIILIGYNSKDKRGDKKVKLSNRIAAAIAADTDVQTVYDNSRLMYSERSNETHEGNNQNITEVELGKLRCYARSVILDFINYYQANYDSLSDKSFAGAKKMYVQSLISRIENLKTMGYLVN